MNDFRSARPTRKIIPIFVACLVAVGGIVFAAQYPKLQAEKMAQNGDTANNSGKNSDVYVAPASNNAAISAVLSQVSASDQDNDGLKDWEEALWKTDPRKEDTDGDGTSDGNEVQAGRNPVVKGPKDTLSTNIELNKATNQQIPEENLTQTDKLGRELLAKYLAAKKNGTLDQEALIQDFVDEQENNIQQKTYKERDILVISAANTTENSLREYGNALGRVLASYPAQKGAKTEFEILQGAIQAGSAAQLEAINPFIASYEGIVRDMLKVRVPPDMAGDHLILVNSLQRILEDIQGFKKTFTDPVVSLISLNRYPSDVQLLVEAFENISITFDQKGIVFEQSEYGYLITHVI